MIADVDAALHLDETARRLLRLDDAQRIACIDRDLWIGCSRAQQAHRRLDRILRSERRMRPDNLLGPKRAVARLLRHQGHRRDLPPRRAARQPLRADGPAALAVG